MEQISVSARMDEMIANSPSSSLGPLSPPTPEAPERGEIRGGERDRQLPVGSGRRDREQTINLQDMYSLCYSGKLVFYTVALN